VSSDSKKRRYFSPSEKISILKEHLINRKSVPDICDSYELQQAVFYRWQATFFQNGERAFQTTHKSTEKSQDTKIKNLEEKISNKDEVIGEIMEDLVKLKKKNGGI